MPRVARGNVREAVAAQRTRTAEEVAVEERDAVTAEALHGTDAAEQLPRLALPEAGEVLGAAQLHLVEIRFATEGAAREFGRQLHPVSTGGDHPARAGVVGDAGPNL